MCSQAFFSVLMFFVMTTNGRVFKPDELATVLRTHNVSDWDIPSLVCVAHKISGLDTSSVTTRIDQGYKKVKLYGVFGLEEAEEEETYRECYCGLSGHQLTDDDITDDVNCLIGCMADTVISHDHHHALSDYLNIYHEVDMKHCFQWWRKLPPVVFPEEACNVIPKTHHLHKFHTPETPSESTPLNRNCKCHCGNSSFVIEISLVLLNIILAILCYIVWSVFGNRKFVRHEFVNITNHS